MKKYNKNNAFVGDDTAKTTKDIINALEELGGNDCFDYKNDNPNTSDYNSCDVLYYFINSNDNIECSPVLPDGYIISDIDLYMVKRCSFDKFPTIVQQLLDKKEADDGKISMYYSNGVVDCFNAINQFGIYTEADVLKLLIDFKNHIGLYRGIQVLDSDIPNWFELIKKK